jgi:hypothetical protein
MIRTRWTVMAALLGSVAACDGAAAEDSAGGTDTGDPDPCADELSVTWANWGEGFFLSYCLSCHSVDSIERFGAPESTNFDTLSDVRTWEERIRVRVLDEATMPVGGGVYDDDLVLLETFLNCGL